MSSSAEYQAERWNGALSECKLIQKKAEQRYDVKLLHKNADDVFDSPGSSKKKKKTMMCKYYQLKKKKQKEDRRELQTEKLI